MLDGIEPRSLDAPFNRQLYSADPRQITSVRTCIIAEMRGVKRAQTFLTQQVPIHSLFQRDVIVAGSQVNGGRALKEACMLGIAASAATCELQTGHQRPTNAYRATQRRFCDPTTATSETLRDSQTCLFVKAKTRLQRMRKYPSILT